jgi:26S proteasome non-ATPase regulatory subunit 9
MVIESSTNGDSIPLNKNDTLRDLVTEPIGKKDEIESEMDSIANTLNSPAFAHIGLRKSLVDEDGFPLAGIDLLQVRTFRNRFAVLETDLKDITARIETVITEIHEHARLTGSVSMGEGRSPVAFGRVDSIAEGSAADEAGLLVGDKILKFGRLSCFNADRVKDCYDAIPVVLREIVGPGTFVEIQVSRLGRESEDIFLRLYPKEGRIGCLIRPV